MPYNIERTNIELPCGYEEAGNPGYEIYSRLHENPLYYITPVLGIGRYALRGDGSIDGSPIDLVNLKQVAQSIEPFDRVKTPSLSEELEQTKVLGRQDRANNPRRGRTSYERTTPYGATLPGIAEYMKNSIGPVDIRYGGYVGWIGKPDVTRFQQGIREYERWTMQRVAINNSIDINSDFVEPIELTRRAPHRSDYFFLLGDDPNNIDSYEPFLVQNIQCDALAAFMLEIDIRNQQNGTPSETRDFEWQPDFGRPVRNSGWNYGGYTLQIGPNKNLASKYADKVEGIYNWTITHPSGEVLEKNGIVRTSRGTDEAHQQELLRKFTECIDTMWRI